MWNCKKMVWVKWAGPEDGSRGVWSFVLGEMGSRGWRLRRVNWRAVDLTRALALPNARCATSPQRIQAALGQRGSCVCSGAELGRMR